MTITTCVFDAYGTLFDVAGAARLAAAEPGQDVLARIWPKLAEDWRRKQLEYTWLREIKHEHTDFRRVTEDGLDWAMEAAGLSDPALRTRLMALYDELPAYTEVPLMLRRLKEAGLQTAILSNGSPRPSHPPVSRSIWTQCCRSSRLAFSSLTRGYTPWWAHVSARSPARFCLSRPMVGTPRQPRASALPPPGSTAPACRWTGCPTARRMC